MRGSNVLPKAEEGEIYSQDVFYPEKWYEMNADIDDILKFRGRLIYSRWRESVKKPTTKFTEILQEVVMSKKPVDVEVWLKHKPKPNVRFDVWVTPIGNPARVRKIKLASEPKTERRVEYLVSDTDIKAFQAVKELYEHRIPISRIQKLFSAGVLGMKIERKLVPLRWAITGVHDIVGRELVKSVKDYPILNDVLLFENSYIGNHYLILLVPDVYQYELIEIKYPKSVWNIYGRKPYIVGDYEPHWGRKSYAENTGGAFYAGRVGVLEYLNKIKKQASVLILREVTEEYNVPVGIWQMQEAIRDAFNKIPAKFESIDDAIRMLKQKVMVDWKKIEMKSKLLRTLKMQKKVSEFV